MTDGPDPEDLLARFQPGETTSSDLRASGAELAGMHGRGGRLRHWFREISSVVRRIGG